MYPTRAELSGKWRTFSPTRTQCRSAGRLSSLILLTKRGVDSREENGWYGRRSPDLSQLGKYLNSLFSLTGDGVRATQVRFEL